jgi:predicted nucleotidyltransferase
MISPTILSRIKSMLQEAFKDRLAGVILYGSEARGDARPDSDIDVLVLLGEPFDRSADSWTCIRTLYPLVLELERPIHAKPTDVRTFESQDCPLFRHVKREGIPA